MPELTKEQIADQINAKQAELKTAIEGKASQQDLKDMKSSLIEEFKELTNVGDKTFKEYSEGLQKGIDSIDAKLKELEQKGEGRAKSIEEAIGESLKSDRYKSYKEKGGSVALELKDTTVSGSTNSGILGQFEPGVASAPNNPPVLWNMLPKGVIGQGANAIYWWERASVTDNAAAVAEGGAFPQSEATWEQKSATITKLGDSFKISREALEDTDFIRGEVMDIIQRNIPNLLEANTLTAILAGAKAFAKLTGFTTLSSGTATHWDVINSAIAQVMIGNNAADSAIMGYMANFLVLHPVDLLNMKSRKNINGDYTIPPFVSADGKVISGLRAIPSLGVTAGSYLLGDANQAKGYLKRGFEIKFWDQNEDDAVHDLITVTASVRTSLKLTTPGKFGFVTGTFAAGKTALETA